MLVSNINTRKQLDGTSSLLAKIMRLQQCCERLQSEVDRKIRISEAQCAVLQVLPQSGTLDTGELCRRAGLSASRGGRVIEELVQAGWADRVPDQADRRINRIRLTPAGRERRQQLEALLGACEATIRSQLAPEQLTAVEASLDLLLQVMEGA